MLRGVASRCTRVQVTTRRSSACYIVANVHNTAMTDNRSGPTSTTQSLKPKRVVLWFRNDLRIHDNVILHEAANRVADGAVHEVLPVYCFDPRWFSSTTYSNGFLKTGPYRAQFLLQSVIDLKRQLKTQLGSDLLIAMGPPEVVIPPLLQDANRGATVLAQSEVTSEEIEAETAVRRALKPLGAKLELFWGSTLFHRDDVPFSQDLNDMPDVFTPFKQKCEDRATVRSCFPVPGKGALPLPSSLPMDMAYQPMGIENINDIVPAGHPHLLSFQPDDRSAFTLLGGETSALKRLKYYLWDSDLVAKYFEIRNGMLGGDYSTKLAPALSHGCISPRQIYHEIKKYESAREANKSTYWVIFELIWRDYFKFYALKHGNAIFHEYGPAGRPGSRTWVKIPDLLKRWKTGTTGWPLVDANMRELAATGWMSNRGRQNVASFLALDLGLDWRLGADWFESLLLDYDVASNWGNWVAAAGLTGGRINKFNITKQSKDYDEQGEYIRHWVPELKNVPASRIHEPWLMSRAEQEAFGCIIGVNYPQAIPSSFKFGQKSDGKQSRFGNKSRGGRGDGRGGRPRSEFELYG